MQLKHRIADRSERDAAEVSGTSSQRQYIYMVEMCVRRKDRQQAGRCR